MQAIKNKTDEQAGVRGEFTAEFFDQRTLSAKESLHNQRLSDRFALGLISRQEMLDGYFFGKKFAQDYRKNVITSVGFNAAAVKRMVGDTTYTGKINKALMGNGVGAATSADTQLISEVYRNDVLSGSEDGNICYLTIVFTEAEVTGTFTEFGNCIDGTAAANTGALFSHLAGLNWVKDANTAIVISGKYTFASI